ncbi:MAG: hypothetical protein LBN34_01775 [Clostridiales Family XIII bacterium]|jgi:hypothetical protein|nr:hypothetical protein [Clostridiales Family XIII bacterium]
MIIFTSICANYLHKARTLAKSIKENIPDATFIVCLLENEHLPNFDYDGFDEIVLAKDAWGEGFDSFIFKHAIVEASTAVKGHFFQYLQSRFPDNEMFLYLDPDIYVYSDFTELKDVLKEHPIVLCPHLLQPGNIDMEISSMAHGTFNLGFLAVDNSGEAREFISWWADRLSRFCYDDIARGIFTDQKWVDLAPCFFDTFIFKHRGYDFGTWSLLDSGMTNENGEIFIKGHPLRFIHFSGFPGTIEMCMRNWLPEGPHPFRNLFEEYAQIHNANNLDEISKTTWSYDTYSSGEKIDNDVRINYREKIYHFPSDYNPFLLSNDELRKTLAQIDRPEPAGYFGKARRILRDEGFSALMQKTRRKLFR